MNGLKIITTQALELARFNHDIIKEIQLNLAVLTLEDLFDITDIFFKKNKPDSNITFTYLLEKYPENITEKIIKGFVRSLEYMVQNNLTEEDTKNIYLILNRRIRISKKVSEVAALKLSEEE